MQSMLLHNFSHVLSVLSCCLSCILWTGMMLTNLKHLHAGLVKTQSPLMCKPTVVYLRAGAICHGGNTDASYHCPEHGKVSRQNGVRLRGLQSVTSWTPVSCPGKQLPQRLASPRKSLDSLGAGCNDGEHLACMRARGFYSWL